MKLEEIRSRTGASDELCALLVKLCVTKTLSAKHSTKVE